MNPQEIEAKFLVSDLIAILAHLQELNAVLVQPRVHETNLRFDTPDRALGDSQRALRLRQDDQVHLTYKGASVTTDGVMSREEIELLVDDISQARLFIEALGFELSFFYEKYRTTFELDGVLIMLDELPYGEFVEIEGEDLAAIRLIAEQLGLRWDAAIARSYHALFEGVADRRQLDHTALRFEAFARNKPTPEELGIASAD